MNCPKHTPLCIYCNKPIVSTGKQRKNGKQHDYWDDKPRKLHKKCMVLRRRQREREDMKITPEEMERLKENHDKIAEALSDFNIHGDPLGRI